MGALLQRLRERLAKRGLSEAPIFGIGHCGGINPKTLAFFKDLSPGTGWHIAKHNRAAARDFPQQRYVEWMYIPDNLPVTPLSPRYLSDGKGLVSVMMQRLHERAAVPDFHADDGRAGLSGGRQRTGPHLPGLLADRDERRGPHPVRVLVRPLSASDRRPAATPVERAFRPRRDGR